ncbi:MAG: shikimate kinase [bacterium]
MDDSKLNKITLIGMPWSGKTTIGKALADKLSYNFLDLDFMVEEHEGASLIEVMNSKGPDYFRDMEYGFLKELVPSNKAVISPAGSIILHKDAIGWITRSTFTVFLDTPFNTIDARSKNAPKAVFGLSERGLKSIWDERQPLYRGYADHIVTTEGKSVDSILDEIISAIHKHIK